MKKRKEIVLILYGKDPHQCFVEGRNVPIEGNGTIDKAKKAPYGLYLLIAHTVMLRKYLKGQIIRNSKLNERGKALVDNVFDKMSRGVTNDVWEAVGWSGEFFKKHPTGRFFQLKPTFGFMKDVHLDVKDFDTQESLTVEELDNFIDYLLGEKVPFVNIKFKVTTPKSHCYKIDNYHYEGAMRAGSTALLTVYSNFPTHFLVFWVTAKGKVMKLHPNIEEDLPKYKTQLIRPKGTKAAVGERKLVIPSNTELGVPTGKGMGTCIVLCYPRNFVNKASLVRERLENLLQNTPFHRSGQAWSYRESKLDDKPRDMKEVEKERGFVSILDANEWENEVIDQLHGVADEVYFLHIPQNPDLA